MSEIVLWQPDSKDIIPKTAKTPVEIANCAEQLTSKEKNQIAFAIQSEFYEMGMTYLWTKAEQALKSELKNVGITLIGEMLGKADVTEDDDINDIITTRDAIKIAEELGMISSTNAMRLKHSHEVINHFTQLDQSEREHLEIEEHEAIGALRTCISAILGRPQIPVAKPFIEFRSALESKTLSADDPNVNMLKSSPYFFYKLTVSVLMNAAKKSSGATLEHSLANINLLIPMIWNNLLDSEKWQVGHTYAETFAEGKSLSVSGLKKTLLKVHGFDYVPENLRSDSFVKAADEIIKAHEGMNNFHNETAPVKHLDSLGTIIPPPALAACISALLCVSLGNSYGTSWSAKVISDKILDHLPSDRWEYYLNHVLPSDTRILSKLEGVGTKPQLNWVNSIVLKHNLDKLTIKNKNVNSLVNASARSNYTAMSKHVESLRIDLYGKAKK
ncbi:hypothetical protein [Vibrio cyclitrophicus]|uniref:Uncharacterized protein n=1 Tax=Vibrio cyclitrophicus ZF270 TaxID=1136176 RepID=A0AAN0LT53_9VIBR|nr:hypothetical protein [Vibrio cyclitrophicus]OEE04132.1 hypothetical protein OC7_09780 [Vibrio cyclitrophicus ZF270]